MFTLDYEVGPNDLESEYAHVHHAGSVKLLELARLRYLEKIGYPLRSLMLSDHFLVVTSLSVKYRREVTAGKIMITCENPQIRGKCVSLEQSILNAAGKRAIEAVVESVFMSGTTRRAIDVPEAFAAAFIVN